MKKQQSKKRYKKQSGRVHSAAATAALLPSALMAGPGDLDTSFGTVGRLGPILDGPAWALAPQDDGTMILGGGRPGYSYSYWSDWYFSPPTAFINRLLADGSIDAGYVTPVVQNIEVTDVARQPDGQVVAVGRRFINANDTAWQLAAYRVQADGSLDTTFATEGLFTLSFVDHGERQFATSVVLDPDGRIVIGGTRDDEAIALRLLPDGSIDSTFGGGGLVIGPENLDFSSDGTGARTSIMQVDGGGYRLTASNAVGCQLFALTADGAPDPGFGGNGLVTAKSAAGLSTNCNEAARQSDGRILVVGQYAGQGFVTRLLPDGQPDGTFSGDAVAGSVETATAVAVGSDGSIIVGGQSDTDASLLRLQPDGALDPSFGLDGSTLIDLEYPYSMAPVVHDIQVDAGGGIVAAGGFDWGAFAIKLLGDAGGDSPGVIGFTDYSFQADGEGSELVLSLRRSGGSAGSVSVEHYAEDESWGSALNGADYDYEPGTLAWDDGDTSGREIRIPIRTDAIVEDPESFGIRLAAVQGGAGLGVYSAVAEIPADGKPFGQISFSEATFHASEGTAAEIWLYRDYYSTGEVSVTVTPRGDTAEAGTDFDAGLLTVSWADGELGPKSAFIAIVDDPDEESVERFSIDLTDAAGGAVLASPVHATVTIGGSDGRPPVRSDNGVGSMGFLSVLLLGTITLLRKLLQYRRPKPASQVRGMPTADCRKTWVK